MKKKLTILLTAIGIFALGTSEIIFTEGGHGDGSRFPTGISGKTGANGGPTCTQCHGGNVNTGGGYIYIKTDIPNFKYQLGKEYNITVTIEDSNAVKYGLDFTAIKSGDTSKVGTLAPLFGTTRLLKGEITHIEPSTSKTFNFIWTAPTTATSVGPANNVTFYVAGLAANGNGHNTGDLVYATNRVVSLDPSQSNVKETHAAINNLSVYPNPATSFINVSYTLDKSKLVVIKLMALNGQLIADLLLEKQDAGLQSKVFQLPENVSAGLYLINIQAEGVEVYNKIVIKK